MKLTICGSMQFHQEMRTAQDSLKNLGHDVAVPSGLDNKDRNEAYMVTDDERITVKIEYDLIREHFKKVGDADAIVVLNYEKKNIPGYIGGNTFLEMGIAFWLGKKIFLLYPVPEMDYRTEMSAMQPTVLDGDLTKIG